MRKKITAVICIVMGVFLLTIFVACARQMEKVPVAKEAAPPAQKVEKAPPAKAITLAKAEKKEAKKEEATKEEKAEKAPPGAELYEQEVKPLAPADCARCHYSIFMDLKKSKSKHRFDCTNCHQQFHVYNPEKKNWKQIMPKCQRCHKLYHGKDFPNCLVCHVDPHSPLTIPFSELTKTKKVGKKEVVMCAICHKPEAKEMAAHPSKHDDVGCQGCHADKHGYIPSCLDCHEPHVEGQTYKDCLVCHSPHSPTVIKQYPEETPNNVCGSCHTQIYEDLKTNHTKHSDLYCATCHTKHGYIPKCQDCHGEPHGAALHKKFPNCLDCHIDPHNLPVLSK